MYITDLVCVYTFYITLCVGVCEIIPFTNITILRLGFALSIQDVLVF